MKKLASLVCCAGAFIKNVCFEVGLITPKRVQVPVISVGNLAFGGTGKTPIVAWLVQRLKDPAVLSRGYRGQYEHSAPQIIDASCSPSLCGDEPALIARMKEKPLVVVGKNRCQSADLAIANGAKVIILDDGMQYRYLHRSYEIVVIPCSQPFQGGLREFPRAIKRADLVVISGIDDKNHTDVVLKELAQLTSAPVCGVRYELASFEGKKVAAFCAIGWPKRFFADLKRAGAEVVATKVKPDHSSFSVAELRAFAESADQAQLLVCTAKDAVKLGEVDLPLPLTVADAKLEFVFGEQHLHKVVYEVMD